MVIGRRSFIISGGLAAMAASWDPAVVRYPDQRMKTLDPRFTPLVLGNAAIEVIASGCRFNEGPVWFGDLRCLLWSDIPNDRMMKWDEETGAVSVFRKPSHYANGNTRDRQGRLITCEMDTQRRDADGARRHDHGAGRKLRRQEADRPQRRRRQIRRLDLVQRQRRRHPRQLSRPQGDCGIAVPGLSARPGHGPDDNCGRRYETAERARLLA